MTGDDPLDEMNLHCEIHRLSWSLSAVLQSSPSDRCCFGGAENGSHGAGVLSSHGAACAALCRWCSL
jgi:hypothetical protein